MYETVNQTTTTYTNVCYEYYTIPPQPQPDPFPSYGLLPPPNYAPFHPQPVYYPNPNVVFPATQPLRSEVVASASRAPLKSEIVAPANRGTSTNTFSRIPKVCKNIKKKRKLIPSQTGVSQSVMCNLCKIACNSVRHYEKHLKGKKHIKKFRMMYASAMPPVVGQSSQPGNNANEMGESVGQCGPSVSGVAADLEAKKQKLLEGGAAPHTLRTCTICNIVCIGEIAFADHVIGKKHFAQERALRTAHIPGAPTFGQLSCELCKISCTNSEGLAIHRQGKRHKKNLKALRNSISDNTGTNASSTPVDPVSVPTAEVDNAEAVQGTVPETEQEKKMGAQPAESMDLETKKQKIMENGVDAGSVRACVICNVVCNSEMVLNSHLAGQKHASMVQRAEAAAVLNSKPVAAYT